MSAEPVLDQLAYRPDQAARIVGVSRSRMYELIRTGAIDSVKTGTGRTSVRLVRREALVAWLDHLEKEAS